MTALLFCLATVLWTLLGLPGLVRAFETRVAVGPARDAGAMIEVRVSHGEPYELTYGILAPQGKSPQGYPLNVGLKSLDPRGIPQMPKLIQTCDVNYIWFGRCITVAISSPGESKIFIIFSPLMLDVFTQERIENILILLKHPTIDPPDIHQIPLTELKAKARKKPPAIHPPGTPL